MKQQCCKYIMQTTFKLWRVTEYFPLQVEPSHPGNKMCLNIKFTRDLSQSQSLRIFLTFYYIYNNIVYRLSHWISSWYYKRKSMHAKDNMSTYNRNAKVF